MLRIAFTALLVAILVAPSAAAQDTLFAANQVDPAGSLLTVNQVTGATTVVGAFGAASIDKVSGMAYNPATDTLLAGSAFDGAAEPLYSVNRITGLLTVIGADVTPPATWDGFSDLAMQPGTNLLFTSDGFTTTTLLTVSQVLADLTLIGTVLAPGAAGNAIEFNAAGTLFWVDDLNLHTIAPATAVILTTTAVTYGPGFPVPPGLRRINSMTRRPADGVMFVCVADGPAGPVTFVTTHLGTIDLVTAIVTFLGTNTVPIDAICFVPPPPAPAAGAAVDPDPHDRRKRLKGCFVGQAGPISSSLCWMLGLVLVTLIAKTSLKRAIA